MTAFVVRREEKDLTKFAFALQQLAEGRSNATGMVTLTPSATSTTVTAINCGAGSVVLLSPTTAHAAAALATTYISSIGMGTFTITHASDSNSDKIFGYICLG